MSAISAIYRPLQGFFLFFLLPVQDSAEYPIEPEENEFEQQDETNNIPLEQWQVISQMGPGQNIEKSDLGYREIDTMLDWHNSLQEYEQYGGLPALLTFMARMKKETAVTNKNNPDTEIMLSHDQQEIVNLAQQQINTLLDPIHTRTDKIPQTTLIQGKAGMS